MMSEVFHLVDVDVVVVTSMYFLSGQLHDSQLHGKCPFMHHIEKPSDAYQGHCNTSAIGLSL